MGDTGHSSVTCGSGLKNHSKHFSSLKRFVDPPSLACGLQDYLQQQICLFSMVFATLECKIPSHFSVGSYVCL